MKYKHEQKQISARTEMILSYVEALRPCAAKWKHVVIKLNEHRL